MDINFQMQLPARIEKDGDYFVSHCPPLDVYSQGETKDKSVKHLIEAVQLFIISCIERGTLDAVLKDCGFYPVTGTNHKSNPVRGEIPITIPIPFELLNDPCPA